MDDDKSNNSQLRRNKNIFDADFDATEIHETTRWRWKKGFKSIIIIQKRKCYLVCIF